MRSSSLTPREQVELARLLGKVVNDDNGFIPDSSYAHIHGLVPWPAVEVLVHDDDGRVLLNNRKDKFQGWHIIGGMMMPDETIQEACDRNLKKDKVSDEGVTDLRLISVHPWLRGEHAYGFHTLSLTIACRARGTIVEVPGLKWFKDIPPDVIPQNHPAFLAHFQEWFTGDRKGFATIIPSGHWKDYPPIT
jgi:hypothetical protein